MPDIAAGSMKEITRVGEETSKIVKTIDEISFQTNLLALNAAAYIANERRIDSQPQGVLSENPVDAKNPEPDPYRPGEDEFEDF
jgi:hypothetical protein